MVAESFTAARFAATVPELAGSPGFVAGLKPAGRELYRYNPAANND